LIVQAIELAAQISRTLAAQQDASAAQQRAAEATRTAAAMASAAAQAAPRGAGWGFTKTGAEVLESARSARVAGERPHPNMRRAADSEPRVDPNEPDR
ncbi:hypothetical protein, partial [Jatrophihabitans endophyticus]|uniref:hypothetical protein n=1 Tax=Jatrophihabitans endophyticus TaxID=1206085 RepID=UPI0026EE368A